jgi:hypothetical protein
MGWKGEELYMEVHSPLVGQEESDMHSLTHITRLLVSATQDRTVVIDWARAEQAFAQATGIPEPVVLGDPASQLVGSTP